MAHALGEMKAALALGIITPDEYQAQSGEWMAEFENLYGEDRPRLDEMLIHTDAYVELIKAHAAEFPGSVVLLERRVDCGVPQCWGTSDVVIYSPTHVEIIDLKYGAGVPVDAHENSQLMLYGVGALDEFGDLLGDTSIVRMTVFQPRLDSTSTYELHPDALRYWRDEVVVPTAKRALSGGAPFGPSDTACRWCPAAGWCTARMEQATAEDFSEDPDLISADDLADLLPKLSGIKSWCDAVAAAALDRAYSQGEVIPGHKVVLSGGKRTIPDAPAAIQTLIDAGYPAEKTTKFQMKPLGELEKLVGKKALPTLLGDLLVKSQGRPALVQEDDNRQPISPASQAAEDFKAA